MKFSALMQVNGGQLKKIKYGFAFWEFPLNRMFDRHDLNVKKNILNFLKSPGLDSTIPSPHMH